MGTTAVVGIVILAWISLSIVLALMVAGTIRLRNQQLPRRSTPKPPTDVTCATRLTHHSGHADGANAARPNFLTRT